MPQLIQKNFQVITKEGECKISISLDLNINLNAGTIDIKTKPVGEEPVEETEAASPWAIPDFKKTKKLHFGKND